ncbi:hypothetical protein ACRZ5S_23170 (plasmid) [Vibrio scophthalmi]|uniref:hypothetical protein n=1 Tax=Vibrio scophthalmi TaxID=45658 RepID=UPI003EC0F27E
MYQEDRIGLFIRGVLFITSIVLMMFARHILINAELPIVEFVFSAFASAALVALFTPSFKLKFQSGDFIGDWEYTNHPATCVNTDTSTSWGQHYDMLRKVSIYYEKGKLKMDSCLDGSSEQHFIVTESITTGFGELTGKLIYHYTSPKHCNATKKGYVILDWTRKDASKPIEKMRGRFYNDTDLSMGEVRWKRVDSQITLPIGETTQQA